MSLLDRIRKGPAILDVGEFHQAELVHVPEHSTPRLFVKVPGNEWTFTRVRTGCLRVQHGDFTAYVPAEGIDALRRFLEPAQ